jgi:hypothetical protein
MVARLGGLSEEEEAETRFALSLSSTSTQLSTFPSSFCSDDTAMPCCSSCWSTWAIEIINAYAWPLILAFISFLVALKNGLVKGNGAKAGAVQGTKGDKQQ